MATHKDEAERLRTVALENAQSIFLARQRAEEALVRTTEALELRTHELAHSLARLRATLEATTDGILVTDGQGQVTDFNAQFVTLWRLPRAVLDTRALPQVLSVMSQSCTEPGQVLARMEATLAASPPETEDVLACTDGRVVECCSRMQVVAGRPVGRVWSFRDITERRQAEATRLRLAAIVASSEDAIVSKSLDGIITSWNVGAERLFGYQAEEMIGHSIRRVIPADRQAEEDNILARLRRGERVEHFETVRRTKDGRLLDVSVTISPLRDEQGGIIGAAKIARDITARRRAEEALARAHTDLQQIAYSAAHDLQEPVRQVALYTEQLAQRAGGALDSDGREALGFIVGGARHLRAQLRDLLQYLEVDMTPAARIPTECEAVLRRALDHLRPALAASGAAVSHSALPTLHVVPSQLQLLLQELIDNALKFHGSAPPRVHLWAEREARGWRFQVRDHGVGIDTRHYDQLFSFFRQLDRHRTPGTGMGLVICKRVVERHGGRIWLEPTPGGGVTVVFTIIEIVAGADGQPT